MSEADDDDQGGLGRRGALATFLGAASIASVATARPAHAAPASNIRKTKKGLSDTAGSPDTGTVASAPVPGYAYQTLMYLDFNALDPSAAARTFGGNGVYSTTTLQASLEIPAGAVFRDIEWYVTNSSGSNRNYYCALWTSQDGYITTLSTTTVVSSPAMTATRTLTDGASYGPYPQGSKLVLFCSTSSDNQLNGVRVGFINGGLEYAVRAVPDVFYNSVAAGGKFANNETRTITVSGVDPGTTGVVLRVTAFSSASPGTVKIYPANQAAPDDDALSILASQNSVGEVTVMLPSNRSRQIKVAVTRGVHLRLAVVATLR